MLVCYYYSVSLANLAMSSVTSVLNILIIVKVMGYPCLNLQWFATEACPFFCFCSSWIIACNCGQIDRWVLQHLLMFQMGNKHFVFSSATMPSDLVMADKLTSQSVTAVSFDLITKTSHLKLTCNVSSMKEKPWWCFGKVVKTTLSSDFAAYYEWL